MFEEVDTRLNPGISHEVVKNASTTSLIVAGMGGLGIEIAKNAILMGVKNITIQDSKTVSYSDLYDQSFYSESDIGKNRAEVAYKKLQKLNIHIVVTPTTDDMSKELVSKFSIAIFTEIYPYSQLLQITDFCHEKGVRIIIAQVSGLFGFVFEDFGRKYSVDEPKDITPAKFMVDYITNDRYGIVTVAGGERHGLYTGDQVKFEEIEGMEEVMGKTYTIRCLTPTKFSIGDTSQFHPFTRKSGKNGFCTQVLQHVMLEGKSLRKSFQNPIVLNADINYYGRENEIAVFFISLAKYIEVYQDEKMEFAKFLEIAQNIAKEYHFSNNINQELANDFIQQVNIVIAQLCTTIGGIISQEIVKCLTSKFTPIRSYFALFAKPDSNSKVDKYEIYKKLFGSELHEKLANLQNTVRNINIYQLIADKEKEANQEKTSQQSSTRIIPPPPPSSLKSPIIHTNRVVKVTINDQEHVWKELAKNIFSDYRFPIPSSLAKMNFKHIGASVFLEFIPETQDYSKSVQVGADPYQRPYVSIYAVRAKSTQNLPPSTVAGIQKWISEASIVGNSWRVFIFQEDSSFFQSAKPINKGELVADQAQMNNVIIVPCKKSKLPDQSIEQVKAAMSAAAIESFAKYDQDTRAKIKRKAGKTDAVNYLKAWRGLLLNYYGYYEDALASFLDAYKSSLQTLQAIPLKPFNVKCITTYPFESMNDGISILYFALHGIFSIYFTRVKFDEMFKFFLTFWGLVQEKNKKEDVEIWAETSLKSFLTIPEIANSNTVNYRILERLFYLNLQKNTKEVSQIRKRLLSVLPSHLVNTRIAIETRYANWAAETKSEMPEVDTKTIAWKFGATGMLFNFDDAIENKNTREIERITKIILTDKSAVENKQKIFQKILDLKKNIKILKPFSVSKFVKCSQFGSEVEQGEKMDISIKLVMPPWFNSQIEQIDVEFTNSDGNSQIESIYNPESEFSKITTSFTLVGDWIATSMRAIIQNVTFEWPVNDKFARFTVVPIRKPLITVFFPVLTSINKEMIFDFTVDFRERLNKEIDIEMKFDTDDIVIPDQTGICETNGKKTFFRISDGNVLFSFEKDCTLDDCISLAGLEIRCPIAFIMKKQIEETNLVITSKFDQLKFETEIPAMFWFPIDVYIRMKTEKFMHVRLSNTSEIVLKIEQCSIGNSKWENIRLEGGESTFLLCENTDDQILKLTVSEPLGSRIYNEWNLGQQKIGLPMIDCEIGDLKLVEGEPSTLTMKLPECDLEINEVKSIAMATAIKRHFPGGKLEIDFIPLKYGFLRMPTINIDEDEFILNPQYIYVEKSNVPSYIPFV